MNEPPTTSEPTRRRWFQYRLRTLLLLTLVVSLLLAWMRSGVVTYSRETQVIDELSTFGLVTIPLFDRDLLVYPVPQYTTPDRPLQRAEREWLGPTWLQTPCDKFDLPVYYRIADLSLLDPAFTDECVDHIVQLRDLKTLYIDHTNITPAGADRIRAALPNVELDYAEKVKPDLKIDRQDEAWLDRIKKRQLPE